MRASWINTAIPTDISAEHGEADSFATRSVA
jgi:hypothetical protein